MEALDLVGLARIGDAQTPSVSCERDFLFRGVDLSLDPFELVGFAKLSLERMIEITEAG